MRDMPASRNVSDRLVLLNRTKSPTATGFNSAARWEQPSKFSQIHRPATAPTALRDAQVGKPTPQRVAGSECHKRDWTLAFDGEHQTWRLDEFHAGERWPWMMWLQCAHWPARHGAIARTAAPATHSVCRVVHAAGASMRCDSLRPRHPARRLGNLRHSLANNRKTERVRAGRATTLPSPIPTHVPSGRPDRSIPNRLSRDSPGIPDNPGRPFPERRGLPSQLRG